MQPSNRGNAWRTFVFWAQISAGLLLMANASVVNAQTANVSGINSQADQCNGPLGALLPECQASGASMDLPSIRQVPGNGVPQVSDRDALEEGKRPSMMPMPEQPLAPEPPSEFQRFIASSVGEVLPIYGAALFERVPTTFAPLDRVPVTDDYVVGPGDEILLRVWGQLGLNLKLTVDRAGAVYIPQVGSVTVSGIQFKQLPEYLKSQMERVFRNFDLAVNMGQLRSVQIFVMGAARRPGTYTVSSLSTMVNALFASGGPSAQGSMRRIQLKRGAEVAAELDFYDLLLRGDKSGDVRLLPGDVVYIPPVGSQVAVVGSVKTPAIYELKDEKTVGELVQMSGGLSAVADRQRATLESIKEGTSRGILELPLTETGMSLPVSNGDMLRVYTIVPRFEDAVTLRGNVANPGRFRWHSGMRLKEIIPDKESLVTRDYWKKQNLLGYTPVEDFADAPGMDNQRTRMDGQRTWMDSQQRGPTDAQRTPMDSQRTSMDTQRESMDAQRESMDAQRTSMDTQRAPMDTQRASMDAQRASTGTQIDFPVADINWSYAVIERQNPKDLMTKLIPFHPGKLILENDESQNLELLSGDVVTIFSQADIRVPQMQQTRTVRLEGEFNAPGIYNVEPGETLGQLIQKAGGLTPQAYLFGAEFLRESVRRDQQKRLVQYIQDLEQEADRASKNRLVNAAPGEESTRLTAEVQSQQQMVQRLRLLQATGRIVLGQKPGNNDISPIAHMTLENGDQFIVPAKPATVNVMGAVYSPNALVYTENRPVKEYIGQAGGYTRNADDGRVYIIRADGAVLPKKGTSGFEKMGLNPGDTIVVPEYLFKTTFLTGLRNWSQVVSNFALGVAAINVLR